METEIAFPAAQAPRSRPKRKKLPPLFWILLVLLACTILTGLGSLGYYFFLTLDQPQKTGGPDAWGALRADEISPGLAAWQLTDIAPEDIFRQAMSLNELGSATALTLTTPNLRASQRLGWLATLARRYAASGQKQRASVYYTLAADIAMLDPNIGDRQRSEALVDVANGWAEMGDKETARQMIEQVIVLAQFSPELTTTSRRQVLEAAGDAFDRLGDVARAQVVRALPTGAPPARPPQDWADPFDALSTVASYTKDVEEFKRARVLAAQNYVDAWADRGGNVAPGAQQALELTLLDEDLARNVYYQQRLVNSQPGSTERAITLWDQIQWLALKRRDAYQLNNVTLVANWTGERPAIEQNLHDANGNLTSALVENVKALPANQQAPALFTLYRHILILARLGLYPDADHVFLANALNDALDQWAVANGVFPHAIIDGDAVRLELIWVTR